MKTTPVGKLSRKKHVYPGLVRWFGGKGQMLANLLPLIPETGLYCEPYGGAASLLLNIRPRKVEVYNDLDSRLVNYCRVLQDKDKCNELVRRLRFTLYSFDEFQRALELMHLDDEVDRAWAFFVGCNQGFGGICKTRGHWGRSLKYESQITNSWRNRVALLPAIAERMASVQIDNRCAIQCIKYWDSADTTFYLDPPYHHDTRTSSDDYSVEQDHQHHIKLVETLLTIKGCAVLSCYMHEVYGPLLDAGWQKYSFDVGCFATAATRNYLAKTDTKSRRTEIVLLNPKAARHLRLGEQRGFEFG